jgi:hypothetical protein
MLTFSEVPSDCGMLGLSVPFDYLQAAPTVLETDGDAFHGDVPALLSAAAGDRSAFASVTVTRLKGGLDPRGSPRCIS